MNIADPTLGIHPVARAILALLEREPAFAYWDGTHAHGRYLVEFDTRAWYNGRERGVSLTMWGIGGVAPRLAVVFGENRTSDHIFVDSYLSPAWDAPCPQDDNYEGAYHLRRLFRASDVAEAAAFIYETLKEYYLAHFEKPVGAIGPCPAVLPSVLPDPERIAP